MLAKISFPGENTCEMKIRAHVSHRFAFWAFQANTLSERLREGIEDIHSRVQPFCPPFIATPGLVELLDLFLKDGENGTRRVAGLELCGKWMSNKVLFCTLFVCVQGIVEDELEVGG
jgi:hypothetical protein